ncbi:MAG: dihydrodipicolinate synthase family protein, partial [Oscillospiraceae bacterium]|nr:dihydrodipicolinate synthase family protein [Oscillospiraceae bacterium]
TQAMVKMTHLCLENDFAAASQIQLEYADLIDALFSDVNPIPVKAALNLINKKAGSLRLPLCEMTPEHLETLKNAMIRIGLLC